MVLICVKKKKTGDQSKWRDPDSRLHSNISLIGYVIITQSFNDISYK